MHTPRSSGLSWLCHHISGRWSNANDGNAFESNAGLRPTSQLFSNPLPMQGLHQNRRRGGMIREQACGGLQRAREWRCDDQVNCHVAQHFARHLNLLPTDVAQRSIVVERIDAAARGCGIERRFAMANAQDGLCDGPSHSWCPWVVVGPGVAGATRRPTVKSGRSHSTSLRALSTSSATRKASPAAGRPQYTAVCRRISRSSSTVQPLLSAPSTWLRSWRDG